MPVLYVYQRQVHCSWREPSDLENSRSDAVIRPSKLLPRTCIVSLSAMWDAVSIKGRRVLTWKLYLASFFYFIFTHSNLALGPP